MDYLFATAAILIIVGFVVDWVLKEKNVATVHAHFNSTGHISVEELLLSITNWFCSIFDALYGTKTWSLRRLWRSAVLSVLFVVFSILLIGIHNTYLAEMAGRGAYGDVLTVSIFFTFVNIIVDFVSLQETRWVIEKVRRAKVGYNVAFWVCVDLVLTTAIYLAGFGLVFTLVGLAMGEDPALIGELILAGTFVKVFFAADQAMPFFVSTFATSIVWYIFVFCVLLAIIASRRSRWFALFLLALKKTENPAGVAVGILVGSILAGLFVVKASLWLLVG